MGVYQSVTAPTVRRKSFSYSPLPHELEVFGVEDLAFRLRRANKIPLKVEPEVLEDFVGTILRFSWFEVETYN